MTEPSILSLRILSPKKCVICEKLFTPTSPNSTYCRECIDANLVKRFRIHTENLGYCAHCGKKVDRLMRWCKNEECQAAKKEEIDARRAKNKEKRLQSIKERQSVFRQARKLNEKRLKGKPRVCVKCGKDPYPNMMYCKSCHASITSTYSGLEEASAEWGLQ